MVPSIRLALCVTLEQNHLRFLRDARNDLVTPLPRHTGWDTRTDKRFFAALWMTLVLQIIQLVITSILANGPKEAHKKELVCGGA